MISVLKSPIVIIVLTQLLFTTSDLIARANMKQSDFEVSTFISKWFLIYFIIRQIAMFGQLYVFANIEVGKTMALFGAVSIVLVNFLGILLLGEVLSTQAYVGITIAIFAYIVLAFSP